MSDDKERIAQLERELGDAYRTIERLSTLLRGTAIGLKGPQPTLVWWDWSDLPEVATRMRKLQTAFARFYNQHLLSSMFRYDETPAMEEAMKEHYEAVDPTCKCGYRHKKEE